MKSFIRLIVMIIVFGVMICSVYYLVNENKKYQDTQICGYKDKQNTGLIENNEEGNKDEHKEIKNEKSDVVEPSYDFFDSSVEEQIAYIKLIEQRNIGANASKTIEENVGLETIGVEYKDLFTEAQMDSALVVIQVAGSMISIMPYSDFIDAQEFHYDDNGNLVLFTYTETGRGLKSRYYVNRNEIISIEREQEEPIETEKVDEVVNTISSGEEMNVSGETIQKNEPTVEVEKIDFDDMFARSKALYEKYIKSR